MRVKAVEKRGNTREKMFTAAGLKKVEKKRES
jgi:hypothetical protein